VFWWVAMGIGRRVHHADARWLDCQQMLDLRCGEVGYGDNQSLRAGGAGLPVKRLEIRVRSNRRSSRTGRESGDGRPPLASTR